MQSLYSPGPFGMRLLDFVTDCVMLEGKERVKQLHSEPPIVTEAHLGRAIAIAWEKAIFCANPFQDELSMRTIVSQRQCDALA